MLKREPAKNIGKTSARFPTFRDVTHFDPKQHFRAIVKSHGLTNMSRADSARLLAKVTELLHGSPASLGQADVELERLIEEIKRKKK